MKALFRFFRGELNGFLIHTLCTFINKHLKKIGVLDELAYHNSMRWELQGRMPIRESDIFSIGKVGGLFQPTTIAETTLGSVWFTPSNIVSGRQRSERGLLEHEYGSFLFVRTLRDDYTTDINTLASKALRTSLVEPGAEILGYVPDGVALFDESGNLYTEAILNTPPDDTAYIVWYGLKYLHYKEVFGIIEPMDAATFMRLFEMLQRIRRAGANIASLLEITAFMCQGYVYDLEIEQTDWRFVCYYSLDEDAPIADKEKLLAAWLNICRKKFNQMSFSVRVGG